MNWKLAFSALALGCASLAAPGCAADADPIDDADAEEAASSQDEINAAQAKLVGAYDGTSAPIQPPTFQGLVFNADGSFFADVDTGIRCITAPCPSHVRLAGRFTATKSYVRLVAKAGSEPSSYYGRYKYTLAGTKLTLSRTGSTWSNDFQKQGSYCAQPSDCNAQGLFHPMCVGSWTCGTPTSGNTCSYKCGVRPVDDGVYPSDATNLVAQSSGGGFTPPPPPGSTCAVGASKYSLDVATRTVTYETCKLVNWQTPLTKQTGTKVLTTAQLAAITTAAKAMTIATQDICGADKPMLSVTVTSASQGTKTFKDSFYACQGNGTYVNDIDGVFAAFRSAVGN